jgi:uncharacterized membrane protein
VSGVREQIDITAPVQRVWAVVHGDIANVPRWSKSLARAEVVGGGPLGLGSELRYEIRLPTGNTYTLLLTVHRYEEFRVCSGTLEARGLTGTWAWRYRTGSGTTTVIYETEVKLSGMLRVAGGVVVGQMAGDVRQNLDALKAYVEAGNGPR